MRIYLRIIQLRLAVLLNPLSGASVDGLRGLRILTRIVMMNSTHLHVSRRQLGLDFTTIEPTSERHDCDHEMDPVGFELFWSGCWLLHGSVGLSFLLML